MFIGKTVAIGLLIIIPLYLATLLVLKGMKSVMVLVRPLANLLPDSLPAEHIISLLLVLVICFLIGLTAYSKAGHACRQWIEKTFFELKKKSRSNKRTIPGLK